MYLFFVIPSQLGSLAILHTNSLKHSTNIKRKEKERKKAFKYVVYFFHEYLYHKITRKLYSRIRINFPLSRKSCTFLWFTRLMDRSISVLIVEKKRADRNQRKKDWWGLFDCISTRSCKEERVLFAIANKSPSPTRHCYGGAPRNSRKSHGIVQGNYTLTCTSRFHVCLTNGKSRKKFNKQLIIPSHEMKSLEHESSFTEINPTNRKCIPS